MFALVTMHILLHIIGTYLFNAILAFASAMFTSKAILDAGAVDALCLVEMVKFM